MIEGRCPQVDVRGMKLQDSIVRKPDLTADPIAEAANPSLGRVQCEIVETPVVLDCAVDTQFDTTPVQVDRLMKSDARAPSRRVTLNLKTLQPRCQ